METEVCKEQGDDSKTVNESPSSSRDLSKSLPEDAFNNFLQGKRHMLVQDYKFAVQSLATACELYVKHFGELAIECGEVYFLYGKALFRLSQQQSGVLGDAINEGSNDDDEEEENENESEEEENKENDSERNNSEEEENKENDNERNNSETEGDDENAEADSTVKEEKEPSESTDSPQAAVDEGSKDTTEKNQEGEVPEAETTTQESSAAEENQQDSEMEDDLELAWNLLETAKSIFKKRPDKESQLKVAEILQLLAEISMESDNNIAAINDLKECLSVQEKFLDADSRLLAETYYQMGLAQMLDKQYTEALCNFKTTMNILQKRKENLKKEPVSEADGSFERADKEIEIADLEGILNDIKEKIEDTEELIRNTKKELEEAFMKGSKSISAVQESGESSSKPVSNITHLLKRKKPEGDNDDVESKRVKLSSSVPNGDSSVVSETMSTSEV